MCPFICLVTECTFSKGYFLFHYLLHDIFLTLHQISILSYYLPCNCSEWRVYLLLPNGAYNLSKIREKQCYLNRTRHNGPHLLFFKALANFLMILLIKLNLGLIY